MKYYSNYNTFVHSMKKTGRLQDPTTLTTTLASPTMARKIHSLVVHYNKHSLVHWQGSMVQVGQWMRYSMKLWWPGAKYLLCRARLSWHLCTLVDREAWRCLRNVSWCCLLIYLFQEQLLSSGPCSGMKNHNQRLPCAWWTRIPDAELPHLRISSRSAIVVSIVSQYSYDSGTLNALPEALSWQQKLLCKPWSMPRQTSWCCEQNLQTHVGTTSHWLPWVNNIHWNKCMRVIL